MDFAKVHLETRLYINGKFVDAQSGNKIKVINPSTGELLTEITQAGKEDVQLAIEAARVAFESGPWRKLTAYERGQIIDKIGHVLLKHTE